MKLYLNYDNLSHVKYVGSPASLKNETTNVMIFRVIYFVAIYQSGFGKTRDVKFFNNCRLQTIVLQ